MNKAVARHALLSLLATTMLASGSLKPIRTDAAPTPQGQKIVAVVKAERGSLERNIAFSAELRPYEETDLHAKVAGYLKTINVDIGDQVKAGQTLATLDVEELRDDLRHADAAFHDAQLNYDRIRQVIAKRPDLLAQEEVDKAQAAYEMAKASREHAATMLGYTTITAPFSGIITHRYVDPGTLIQAGISSSSQAMPVVHLAENTKLRMVFPVPESVVPNVRVGTLVEIVITATGQTSPGKIARTSGKVDTTTRTMEAEVDVDNADRRITPGMYASVTVQLDKKINALALPIEAVSLTGRHTVWRITAENKVEEVPVTTGLQTDSRIEITGGLRDGDQVLYGSRSVTNIGDAVEPKLMAAK